MHYSACGTRQGVPCSLHPRPATRRRQPRRAPRRTLDRQSSSFEQACGINGESLHCHPLCHREHPSPHSPSHVIAHGTAEESCGLLCASTCGMLCGWAWGTAWRRASAQARWFTPAPNKENSPIHRAKKPATTGMNRLEAVTRAWVAMQEGHVITYHKRYCRVLAEKDCPCDPHVFYPGDLRTPTQVLDYLIASERCH